MEEEDSAGKDRPDSADDSHQAAGLEVDGEYHLGPRVAAEAAAQSIVDVFCSQNAAAEAVAGAAAVVAALDAVEMCPVVGDAPTVEPAVDAW